MSVIYAQNTDRYIDTDTDVESVCEGCGENEWTQETLGIFVCDDCADEIEKGFFKSDVYRIVSKLKKGYKLAVEK